MAEIIVVTSGKGGVGKTTLAAAVAVALATRGLDVHLSTSDPAAHLAQTLHGTLDHLTVSRIDPHEVTETYRAQVLAGLSMGDGWYLRALPVWFARRGNYGVLLSQAKALSAAARLRGDSAGLDLAQRQAQWVVGRNPFTQSTMYGEGYDWAQQYSVSAGDFVGSLPVGMQSRGDSDLPYWPSQNMYVYKEVWVHSTSRWLWLMEDLLADETRMDPGFTVTTSSTANGELTIRATATGVGAHTFAIRAENLVVAQPSRTVTLTAGMPTTIEWKARVASAESPWVAVVIADNDPSRRREAAGSDSATNRNADRR